MKYSTVHQWFITKGSPQGGSNPYDPYNMESLTIKFINKFVCFFSAFKVRGIDTKDNYLSEAR